LTGSGTILADDPAFTVRKVTDHAGKTRWLMVMDRRSRVPDAWLDRAAERGLKAKRGVDLEGTLDFLGREGCLEVLVEAGPDLTRAVLATDLWDEDVKVEVRGDGSPDQVMIRRRAQGPKG
ncbi:MAG TPA: dihydrofolate reductase family protein, partial [Bdellovibrionota bacterium]|nr:dihydrofolate reductase family protein [Bdellovibrionota bacterium]